MSRKIIDFIKSPSGRFLLFFLAVIIFAMLFRYYKSLPDKKKESGSTFHDALDIDREYVRFRDEYEQLQSRVNEPVKSKLEKEVEEKKEENKELEKKLTALEKALAAEKLRNSVLRIHSKAPETAKDEKQEKTFPAFSLSPVNLYTAKVKKEAAPKQPLKNYAPYGRLIKCQLVNTIDSSSFDTPVIALVTENVWHQGKIIIPAGTEVHGTAASLTQRNRIATEKDWVMVWRTKTLENGFELPLSALALDYSQDIKSGSYGITDGSAGLRGDIIETGEYSKLKLYAALFLKGAAAGVSELLLEEAKSQDQNTFINSGTESSSEEKNSSKSQVKIGLAKGAEQAIEHYTRQMLDAISRDGVFVRVPAGRFFYLYVTQTIDKNKAFPGASGAAVKAELPEKDESEERIKEAQQMLLSLTRQRVEEEKKNERIRETDNDQ